MAADHSFDVVCKLDKQEIVNAVQQTERETQQRYDFKGARVGLHFDPAAMTLTLTADSDFRLRSLADVLDTRLAKRGIPLAAVSRGPIETASSGHARQEYRLQTGIPAEAAREIVKRIKGMKRKLQAAIQGDQVRVSGRVLDDLQAVQGMLREADLKIHLQFVNYR